MGVGKWTFKRAGGGAESEGRGGEGKRVGAEKRRNIARYVPLKRSIAHCSNSSSLISAVGATS